MWQKLKNYYHLVVALLANIYYGFPSRKLVIIGITGTSGKTTTTHMIFEVLKAAGYKVSLLSTIKAVIGGEEQDTGFHVTTPDPHKLPKYLAEAVAKGGTHFVLEISSHALDQNRAAFVNFHIGVLTTLAHEHLDYHKTIENYALAKFKLLHQSKYVVLPQEGIANEIKQVVRFDALENVQTFGLEKGDVTRKDFPLKMKMPGLFNFKNALAAATVGKILDIPKKTIISALEGFSGVEGRFEEIPTGNDFRVVIDFAHKPDAIEGVIVAAREQIKGKGRVIIMYGCAAQRDLLKRPIMGEISGRLAEITILTDEDPRDEEPMKIINEIAQGCVKAHAIEKVKNDSKRDDKQHVFYKIPNRKEAITFAITKLAQSGDIILFCGKGHESSMNYNGKELPYSEHAAVAEALKKIS